MTSRIHQCLVYLFLCFIAFFFDLPFGSTQSCAIRTLNDEPILIQSTDTVALRFRIADALQNELGANGQGLCGVNLEFIHQDVTDLNMTLYSPAGVPVILVGPAVTASSSVKPFGVAHDITFVPSTATTSPDPGMPDRWDNQDPDWGTQSAYAGVYFPFSGDIDLNYATGPVNGIWELVIVDQFPTVQNESRFMSFELEFCDANLTCADCEAISGSFMTDSIAICEGQEFDFKSIYSSAIIDDSLYTEIFLSYSGDQLFTRDSLPDFEGAFESYVVTILKDQEAMFRQELNTLNNRVNLLNLIAAPGGVYCIDISPPLSVAINQTSGIIARVAMDTVLLTCVDTEVELDGSLSVTTDSTMFFWTDMDNNILSNASKISVSESGQYTLTLDDNVCVDSTQITVISEADQASAVLAATFDTLSCSAESSVLSYGTDIAVLQSNWLNQVGDIMSTDTSVLINDPGVYYLQLVGNGECSVYDSIIIASDYSVPEASLVLDSITCANRDVTIRLTDEVNTRDYLWQDAQSNVISQTNNMTTTSGGEYTLLLTAPNGCDTAFMFSIPVDTIAPELLGIPVDTFFTCLSDSIILGLRAVPEIDYILSQSIDGGPFSIVEDDPIITIGGSYLFTTNFDNGCIARYTSEVVDNRFSIDSSLADLILTCDIDSLQVTLDIDTSLFSFRWSGGPLEGNIYPFPYVNESGDYTLVATEPITECTATYDITVLSDRDDPVVSLIGDSLLTCLAPSAIIEVNTDDSAEVSWVFPNNDTLNEAMISTTTAGTFRYIVEADNGCTVTGVWLVAEDINLPSLDLQDQYFITCTEPVVELSVDSSEVESVNWYYKDNSVSNELGITLTGDDLDSIVVMGTNGCENSRIVEVLIDQIAPMIDIPNRDTVICTPSTLLLEVTADQAPDQLRFEWINDNITVGTGTNLLTNETGQFVMMATLLRNGCTASDSVMISLTENPILGFEIEVMDESCAGDADGSLSLVGIEGGVEPFTYLLDGEDWMSTSSTDLAAGDYLVRISDANNCVVDSVASIRPGADLSVSLGPDQSTDVGSTITVSAATTGEVQDFGWFVNGQNNPNGDLSVIQLTPESDLEVILQIFSEEGCTAMDTMYVDAVFTIDNVDMYIPNAFAINGTERNNALRVNLTEAILSVDRFRVFDRWGALVHEVQQPQGRFNVELWNGNVNGSDANPGVYIYVCEVTTAVDNLPKVFKGNVTVFD